MDISLREEKLGKALIEAYKGKLFPAQKSFLDYKFRVQFPGMMPGFRNWHEFLFGSGTDENYQSANYYLKKWTDADIIDYDSLDELDIQLTLMGMSVK